MKNIKSMSVLRNTTAENNGEIVLLTSFYENKSIGGGLFIWDAASTAADDLGCIIKTNSSQMGRWLRFVTHYVNYDMFGADATGVDVSDQRLVNCHNFANTNNLMVIQKSGVFLWRKLSIPVMTDCDLTGATIKTDALSGSTKPTYGSPEIYRIKSRQSAITLTNEELGELNNNFNHYMVPNGFYIPYPPFMQQKDSLIILSTNEVDMLRSGSEKIYKKDLIITTKDGGLLIGFNKDLSQGNITSAKIIPKENHSLSFKSPTIKCYSSVSFKFIVCNRSNTTIKDVVHTEAEEYAPQIRSMVYVSEADNVRLINFDQEALPRTNYPDGTYGISMNCVTRVTFQKINGNDGWGLTGCNYMKSIYVNNCSFNRFDCHWMVYDVIIENSTFKNWGIIMTGGGHFIARNCIYTLGKSITQGDTLQTAFFKSRADYAQEWDGSILIDGLTIRMDKQLNTSNVCVVQFTPISFNPHRDIKWPHEINIKNITFDGANGISGNYFQGIGVYLDANISSNVIGSNNNLRVVCPNKVSIDGLSFSNSSVNAIGTAIKWLRFGGAATYIESNKMRHKTSGTTVDISVRNIQSRTKNGITVNNDSHSTIQLVHAIPNWDESWYTDDNENAALFNVTIDSCSSTFIDFSARGRVSASNSIIHSIDIYAGKKSPGSTIRLSSCTIAPVSRNPTSNQWFLGEDESVFIGCEFRRPLNYLGELADNIGGARLYGSSNYTLSKSAFDVYNSHTSSGFWAEFVPENTLVNTI